ncbi:transcriptional regulator, RpiR family [Propionispira arboris]|uniref:Transcriptional regulator, RpiR family n=1 Tax=Propionispira arboris TaxID=84035 RepID=A0A1H7D9U3_9FIRM|nr:hypothetical protein [Propionispira arboris]SEJ97647.1 transcriptional regulator, RpiR family [Propionispira arboris]
MENKKEIKVIDQIFSCYNELFDAEKRVADYILENSDKVIEMTVSELADASEASNATIVRVCKKCGCKGFHHLKIKMAKETTDSEKKYPMILISMTLSSHFIIFCQTNMKN